METPKLKTQEVVEKLVATEKYKDVVLEWNVDTTACLLVRNSEGKIYSEKVPAEDMKLEVEVLANKLSSRIKFD